MKRPSTRTSTTRRPLRVAAAAVPKLKILLVDDHVLVRHGVRSLLNNEPDMRVVGEAADGREAVVLAAELCPDVVIMDLAMPGLNGIEATRQILERAPAARILILSAHSDEEYVTRALALGVAGYILKQSSLADLGAAIRAACAGACWFSPELSQILGATAAGARRGARPPSAPKALLTVREAEVLQRVAEGKANKQTAVALGISIKTVEKHRQSLMTKLDIHDVAGLTRYAIASGIIEGRDRRSTF